MVNLVKKIKNVSLSLDFVPRLITNLNMRNSIVGFTFFFVRPKRFFLGKFGPKTQYCQFKQKFGPYLNLKMQNSMAVFTFPVLDGKQQFG